MFAQRLQLLFLFSFLSIFGLTAQTTVHTVWGDHVIEDEVTEKVLESHIMQRIKDVAHHGPPEYFVLPMPDWNGVAPAFSRYEHCVGVMVLLAKAGASQVEQIAGLLHDASHTAFSHIGDHLFNHINGHKSYQDLVHLEFLQHMGIADYLEEHGIALGELDPDLPQYKALEQDLPDLCADRIQYSIHAGVIFNKITQDEAKAIVDALHFEDGVWYLDNVEHAKTLARLSIYFTKYLWTSEANYVMYQYFTKALLRAVDLGLIVKDDVKYGTDKTILDILYASHDAELQMLLDRCKNLEGTYDVVPYGQGQENVKPKCRATNPLVKVDGKLVRLTEASTDYAQEYADIHAWCQAGYGVNYEPVVAAVAQ